MWMTDDAVAYKLSNIVVINKIKQGNGWSVWAGMLEDSQAQPNPIN